MSGGIVKTKQVNSLNRREFLEVSAGTLAASVIGLPSAVDSESNWNQGQIVHIIPTSNHERFLIKASFKSPQTAPPILTVSGKPVSGFQTDPRGRFWRFDVASLEPGTQYELRLTDSGGSPLCDAWPLKTMPAPDSIPEHLRILAYTCAGGYDGPPLNGKSFFLDMTARRKLLARALSFQPDVLIANGDHIYWDIETSQNKPFAKFTQGVLWPKFGQPLDTSVPMLHPRNLATFTAICDYQIPGLYGTALRSTPSFFLTDDHDNFENDEFDAKVATMPPDNYGTVGAEQTQRLYYPEFLPDRNRPEWLSGGDKAWAPTGTNITYGTLRYGKLMEVVLYDCRRYADYKGEHAKILPQWTEAWLIARTAAQDTTHFMHAPSLPFAFSSGKLGDWYPDFVDVQLKRLVVFEEKPGWQRGWFAQHQRLIEAISNQTNRSSVIVQGDFHASTAGEIHRSGELKMAQPVHVVTAGTLGTGDLVYPSAFRNIASTPSQLIGMDQALTPTEKNGFSIIDVTPDKLTFAMFTWRPPQPVEEIDTMKPVLVYEVPRHK